MKIYDSVVVFGQEGKVEFSDNVPDDRNAEYHCGTISIHPECPRRELARVFLHEFLHMVCDRTSVSQAIDLPTEEMICDLFSKAITENFYLRFKTRQ